MQTALTVRKDLTLWILGIEGLYLWLVSFRNVLESSPYLDTTR